MPRRDTAGSPHGWRRRINQRFWIQEEGSYADFYGTRPQAISTAEGAIKQIELKRTETT